MIDFETVKLTPKPNQFLIAPEGLCTNAKPHRTAPVFNASAQEVKAAWDAVVAQQPRTRLTDADETQLKFEFVQKTFLFRFPDTITVQFINLPNGEGSTIAVYSRSKIGYSDLDVNKKRIKGWLEQISKSLPVAA